MKFLIDAQLPLALKKWLKDQGYVVCHTLDLPQKNLTQVIQIIETAIRDDRVIITKDADFFNHLVLNGTPPKLLLLTMVNIVNKELLTIFQLNFTQTELLLEKHDVVEMNNSEIIVHF